MKETKQKTLAQMEHDFKKLVLSMLTPDEESVIGEIDSWDLYHLVFASYNPFLSVKSMISSLYEHLDVMHVYNIVIHLRKTKDDLYSKTLLV